MQNMTPDQILEKGWKARENYEFDEAIVLINKAKEMFEKDSNIFMVTECLNHLALTYKIIAFVNNIKAIEYAERSNALAQEHKTSQALTFRTLSSVNKYASNYEQAILYAKKALRLAKKEGDRADIRADLALCYLRTGDKENARKEIETAYNEIEKVFDSMTTVHKYIWKTKIHMFRGLIKFDCGDKVQAKEDFNLAFGIAKENNLKMRQDEAKELLKLL